MIMLNLKDLIIDYVEDFIEHTNMPTLVVSRKNLLKVIKILKEDKSLQFTQLIDLCGVDYIEYGKTEWDTKRTTAGYNRGITEVSHSRLQFTNTRNTDEYKLCVVYHILSIKFNKRIRVKCYLDRDSLIIPSVTKLYASADWYEREAYDLFGILFDGHDDLRRILTDYGFVGHPFRKKFPLTGNTQVAYDPESKKVVNEPVDIDPRTLVPKVIRKSKDE